MRASRIERTRRRSARRAERRRRHNARVIARRGGVDGLSGQQRIDLTLGRRI
jgi:hypothetical protein